MIYCNHTSILTGCAHLAQYTWHDTRKRDEQIFWKCLEQLVDLRSYTGHFFRSKTGWDGNYCCTFTKFPFSFKCCLLVPSHRLFYPSKRLKVWKWKPCSSPRRKKTRVFPLDTESFQNLSNRKFWLNRKSRWVVPVEKSYGCARVGMAGETRIKCWQHSYEIATCWQHSWEIATGTFLHNWS